MRNLIIFYFFALFFNTSAYALDNALTPAEEQKYQQVVLDAVNAYRKTHNRRPLRLNTAVSEQALKHSEKMAMHQVKFGHENFMDRVKNIQSSIKAFGGGAENVAYYKIPPQDVVKNWITSRGHKKNILGHYNTTGIGVFKNKSGWVYYTQIFVQDNDLGG